MKYFNGDPVSKYPQIYLSDLIKKDSKTYAYLLLLTEELSKLDGSLYLVGGIFRDFFSGIKSNSELDCVVDCTLSLQDWEKVIWRVADLLMLKPEELVVRSNPYFLTSSIRGPGLELDFTFPRSEKYDSKNMINNPVIIERANLSIDVLRRDFTFNAIYGLLSKDSSIDINDPLKGIEDLNAKLLRATHNSLFFEDLSRIIRLFRFQKLLGCDIEETTREQLLATINYANDYLTKIENKILQTALHREIQLWAKALNNHDWFEDLLNHNMRFILPEISAATFSRMYTYWQIINPHLSKTTKSLAEIEFFLSHFTPMLAWKPLPKTELKQHPYDFSDLVSNVKVQQEKNNVLFDNKSIIKTVVRYPIECLPDVKLGLQNLRKNAQNLNLLKNFVHDSAERLTQVKDIKRKILLGELF